MAISPDGRFAYVADYNSTLALRRDPNTGALSLIDQYGTYKQPGAGGQDFDLA